MEPRAIYVGFLDINLRPCVASGFNKLSGIFVLGFLEGVLVWPVIGVHNRQLIDPCAGHGYQAIGFALLLDDRLQVVCDRILA